MWGPTSLLQWIPTFYQLFISHRYIEPAKINVVISPISDAILNVRRVYVWCSRIFHRSELVRQTSQNFMGFCREHSMHRLMLASDRIPFCTFCDIFPRFPSSALNHLVNPSWIRMSDSHHWLSQMSPSPSTIVSSWLLSLSRGSTVVEIILAVFFIFAFMVHSFLCPIVAPTFPSLVLPRCCLQPARLLCSLRTSHHANSARILETNESADQCNQIWIPPNLHVQLGEYSCHVEHVGC